MFVVIYFEEKEEKFDEKRHHHYHDRIASYDITSLRINIHKKLRYRYIIYMVRLLIVDCALCVDIMTTDDD